MIKKKRSDSPRGSSPSVLPKTVAPTAPGRYRVKTSLLCRPLATEQWADDRLVKPFFFSSRRRHTRSDRDWSSDVCSSDLLWAGTSDGKVHVTRDGGASWT